MSKLLSLFLALSFLACAPLQMEAGTSKGKGDYYLLSSYTAVSNTEALAYIQSLSAKLFTTSNSCLKDPVPIILKAPYSFALLSESGRIYISTALINSLHSEAELAFILSHEFAHALWCHPPCDMDGKNSKQILDNELKADAFAIKSLALHGYDSNSAYSALTHAYASKGIGNNTGTHPNLTDRIKNLSSVRQRIFEPKKNYPPKSNYFEEFKKTLTR